MKRYILGLLILLLPSLATGATVFGELEPVVIGLATEGEGANYATGAGELFVEGDIETDSNLYVAGTASFVGTITQGGVSYQSNQFGFSTRVSSFTIATSSDSAKDGALVIIKCTDASIELDQYLLRLRYTDDGDSNAHFTVYEDNGGDNVYSVGYDGAIISSSSVTAYSTEPFILKTVNGISGAPSATGILAINSDFELYISTGTASAGDWVRVGEQD